MNDLIERLRDFDLTRQFTGGQHPLITEAADEIERLQAKVDALRDALTLSDRMLREYEAATEQEVSDE